MELTLMEYIFVWSFIILMIVNIGLAILIREDNIMATLFIVIALFMGDSSKHIYIDAKLDYLIELQTPPAVEEVVE